MTVNGDGYCDVSLIKGSYSQHWFGGYDNGKFTFTYIGNFVGIPVDCGMGSSFAGEFDDGPGLFDIGIVFVSSRPAIYCNEI